MEAESTYIIHMGQPEERLVVPGPALLYLTDRGPKVYVLDGDPENLTAELLGRDRAIARALCWLAANRIEES